MSAADKGFARLPSHAGSLAPSSLDRGASNQTSLLSVRNIEVMYQGTILALKNVSFEFQPGAITTILGSNGSGKTTVLRSLSSLLRVHEGLVTDGQIVFEGNRIENSSPVSIVKTGIVQVMQDRRVLEHLTVEQNIRAAAAAAKIRRSDFEDALDALRDMFPRIFEIWNRISGYCSGGEQQIVVIARAMIVRPKVLLLDEPSMGLAPNLVRDIFSAIQKINRDYGTTIVLVEQNASAALNIANYGYVLETGRVVLSGKSAELRDNADLMRFYLGLGDEGQRRNFRDVKHYSRRKRWL